VAVIRRFEDILAWQKARELTNAVYHETSNDAFAKDYPLRDQIRRAAVSIMLNIAEGFGRKTDKEFKQYLVHSHGSCAEVQAALYIALDQRYISRNTFTTIYESAEEISRMVMGLHKAIGRNKSEQQ
jgi:four helix bundle protein